MKSQVIATLFLALILMSSFTVARTLAFTHPNNLPSTRPVPLVRFVEIIVPARSLPPLVGAKTSSLRLALYADGEFYEGIISVIPERARSFFPLYNTSTEIPLFKDRVSESDLLYLMVPLVKVMGKELHGARTADWGVHYAKLRLHSRLAVSLQAFGQLLNIYIYFDYRIECPRPLALYSKLARASIIGGEAQHATAKILDYLLETRRSFLLNPEMTRIVAYDLPRPPRSEPHEPPNYINGGGGFGPKVEEAFSVTAYNGTVAKGNPVSRSIYLGYGLAYPLLYIEAQSLSGSNDNLLVIIRVRNNITGEIMAEEATAYSIPTDPIPIEDLLPVPYTLDIPVSIEITFSAENGEMLVHSNLFFGKDFSPNTEYGEPPELKTAHMYFADPWVKPPDEPLEGGAVTLTAAPLEGVWLGDYSMNNLYLRLNVRYVYPNPPLNTLTVEVYLNNVLVSSQQLTLFINEATLEENHPLDTLYPRIMESLKAGIPLLITIKIPQLEGQDQGWRIEVTANYTARYLPEAWMPGKTSYLLFRHPVGLLSLLVFSGSSLAGIVSTAISSSEYGWFTSGNKPSLGRPQVSLLIVAGRYVPLYTATLRIYIPTTEVPPPSVVPECDVKLGTTSSPTTPLLEKYEVIIFAYSILRKGVEFASLIKRALIPASLDHALAIGDLILFLADIISQGQRLSASVRTSGDGRYYIVEAQWDGFSDYTGYLRLIVYVPVDWQLSSADKTHVRAVPEALFSGRYVYPIYVAEGEIIVGEVVMDSKYSEPWIVYGEYGKLIDELLGG